MIQPFSTTLTTLMNKYLLGPKSRELRTSFASLNTQAADLHAKAAELFDQASQQAEAAQEMEDQEVGGVSFGSGPTAEELQRRSEESFKLAELADVMGDEISEAALMFFERLEERIGAKRASLI